MIVLDASAAVDALLNIGASARIRARIEAEYSDGIRVPHLFEFEVLHTLRREYLRGLLSAERSRIALNRLSTMKLTRHPHTPFIARIWELKENITACAAAYIALAETLDAPLITTDGPLARSSGHRANVEFFEWQRVRMNGSPSGAFVSSGRTISWSGASSRTIKETKSSSGLGMECWNRESRFSRPSFLENFALPPDEPGRGFGGGHPDSRSERSAARPSIRAFHKRFPARRDASERNGDGSRYTAR